MTEKYEPSNKEVYAEMWYGIKDLLKRNLPKTIRLLKDFGVYSGDIAVKVALAPYAIPTGVRKIEESESDGRVSKDWDDYSLAQKVGSWAGAYGGIAIDIGQIVGYYLLAKNDHPEALAIPVATNLISGVYELGRLSYRNARQRILEGPDNKNFKMLSGQTQ